MKFFLFLFFPIIIFSQQSGEVIYSVNIKQNDTLPISAKRWQSSIQFLADSVTSKLLYTEEKAYFELIQDQNYENLIQFFQEQHPRIKNSTYQPEIYFFYDGPTWQINNFNYRFKKKKSLLMIA